MSVPVGHLADAPRRRLVVTGESARIQDETTEGSYLLCSYFNTARTSIYGNITYGPGYNHFKSLFNKYLSPFSYLIEEETDINPTINNDSLNGVITSDEIFKALSLVHSKRSPGLDGILIDVLKHTSSDIGPYLYQLFNEIFHSGEMPLSWGQSIIVLVHKNGSKSDPDNYRGISLIDAICKVFTSISNNRLYKWCEENNIIDESKPGFRKHYSTIDNVFTLTAAVQLLYKNIYQNQGEDFIVFL